MLQALVEHYVRAAIRKRKCRRQLEPIAVGTNLVALDADGLLEFEERERAGFGWIIGRAGKQPEGDDCDRRGKRARTDHRGGGWSFDVLPSATRLASN